MDVTMTAPAEFQGPLIALINKRKGSISDSEVSKDYMEVNAVVPLNNMFGTSTDLRSATQVYITYLNILGKRRVFNGLQDSCTSIEQCSSAIGQRISRSSGCST